jgi:hypothetical protein
MQRGLAFVFDDFISNAEARGGDSNKCVPCEFCGVRLRPGRQQGFQFISYVCRVVTSCVFKLKSKAEYLWQISLTEMRLVLVAITSRFDAIILDKSQLLCDLTYCCFPLQYLRK